MKLYIAAAAVPLADYYGFYVPRMTPFFKTTGGNEIEVVVSTARTVQCWSWGSYNGAGFATVHNDAWISYFASNKYFALMQFKGLNMIVCKLGTAAGTATTGDVMIIPATQSAPDGTNVNNPLPLAVSTTPLLASSFNSLLTACNSVNPAIIAGSDEYLGTMTFISSADTAFANIIQTVAYPGTNSADAFPGAITLNNNADAATRYDITAAANVATTWLIGTTKLNALLLFKQAASAAWTDVRSVMEICGPQAGSTIPTDLVLTAGNDGNGAPCTAAFNYDVGAVDFNVLTNYNERAQRWCRWCSAPANSGTNEVHLADFVPPTTSNRKLTGITVMSAITTGVINLATVAVTTFSVHEPVDVAASACGKTGQTTKINTKGQTVEFTMKSPVPLAVGQHVMWQEITGTPVAFQLSGNLPTNSVECTCGTYTW
jgi:hypothetical protein